MWSQKNCHMFVKLWNLTRYLERSECQTTSSPKLSTAGNNEKMDGEQLQ